VLRRLDRIPGLEGPHAAGLGSPAILNENVVLGTSRDGHELTEAELDAWVATFPIEPMQTVLPALFCLGICRGSRTRPAARPCEIRTIQVGTPGATKPAEDGAATSPDSLWLSEEAA
jgi:hypothetical protein